MYIVTNELETAKHINNEITERLTRRTKDVDEMRKENVSWIKLVFSNLRRKVWNAGYTNISKPLWI